MIKYNSNTINNWYYYDDNIIKVYYGVTSGSTSRLPQGYTEVEYIRNSNYNAYINTDVLPFDNNTNSYTITVKLTSEFHSNLGCATIISSEVPSSPYNGLGYRYKCSSAVDQLEFFGGNANYSSSTVVNGDGTNTITFQSTGNTSWTSSIPLTFCCSFSDTAHTIPNRFADVTIYSATIVKNGSTVRDFVPCKRDSDSVYGLYDLINDVFYSSPNGNNFSGGSAVTPTAATVVGNVVYQKVTNGSTPPTPPEPHDYTKDYLTFVATESGAFGFSSGTVDYSTDSGLTWNTLTQGNTISVNQGDEVLFKMSGATPNEYTGIGTFTSSGRFNIYGNIMSMQDGDNFTSSTAIADEYQFKRLFAESKVVSAENMVLPATTLKNFCYNELFKGSIYLTTPPKIFPATALTQDCYSQSFSGCTSLTKSSVLPALTAARASYGWMFQDNTSLSEVTCLATNVSAQYATYDWLKNVASSGTFYKNPNASWSRGTSGIPSNWTVVDYTG